MPSQRISVISNNSAVPIHNTAGLIADMHDVEWRLGSSHITRRANDRLHETKRALISCPLTTG